MICRSALSQFGSLGQYLTLFSLAWNDRKISVVGLPKATTHRKQLDSNSQPYNRKPQTLNTWPHHNYGFLPIFRYSKHWLYDKFLVLLLPFKLFDSLSPLMQIIQKMKVYEYDGRNNSIRWQMKRSVPISVTCTCVVDTINNSVACGQHYTYQTMRICAGVAEWITDMNEIVSLSPHQAVFHF